jgi:hypothetical protein
MLSVAISFGGSRRLPNIDLAFCVGYIGMEGMYRCFVDGFFVLQSLNLPGHPLKGGGGFALKGPLNVSDMCDGLDEHPKAARNVRNLVRKRRDGEGEGFNKPLHDATLVIMLASICFRLFNQGGDVVSHWGYSPPLSLGR